MRSFCFISVYHNILTSVIFRIGGGNFKNSLGAKNVHTGALLSPPPPPSPGVNRRAGKYEQHLGSDNFHHHPIEQ